MKKNNRTKRFYRPIITVGIIIATMFACKTPTMVHTKENKTVPKDFGVLDTLKDSTNVAVMNWREYFTDSHLITLIDTALKNNQELNITIQEIEIARNEIQAKKGAYLPFVGLGAGAGAEKAGKYTIGGANEEANKIDGNNSNPTFLPSYMFGAYANWEIDIWNKLHNAKKSAVNRYLASVEGKNFMVTNLIAEIANSYYELLALDTQLEILKKNIAIQTGALEIVRLQKKAAKVTELAVRRFEAQVFSTRSVQFDIQQKIIETENRISFLIGKFPGHIERAQGGFINLTPDIIHEGVPAQLLSNRPDVKRAELELVAAKLDVRVAKARFYPSLNLTAGLGYNAFKAKFLLTTPKSLIYSLAGNLTAPLINRKAIKAAYYNANAKQIQAVYNYERTILNAYVEVVNKLSKISNIKKTFDLKDKEVTALTNAIGISNNLFKSARASYMEVLLTQRDALESKMELVDTKKSQMNAFVNIYRTLGGGWK